MSEHLLILPRLRVQNVNCISSPMTWGFPAITAFTGFMVALQRRLMQKGGEANALDSSLRFESVGVVSHRFEPQVTQSGYIRSFALTRNPILHDGDTAAIVEEGRAHLDITLVFTVRTSEAYLSEEDAQSVADAVAAEVAGMRLAGGSIMPSLQKLSLYQCAPRMEMLKADDEARAKQFKQLRRRLLPGFALVSRDDVLQQRLLTLKAKHAGKAATTAPTLLDAWLDLSRINYRAHADEVTGHVSWKSDARPSWLVPMPVGFATLSAHDAGTVTNARDAGTPFRFVESVYSIGQWVSPHRLPNAQAFMWHPHYDEALSLYRCVNEYHAPDDESLDTDVEPEASPDTTNETFSSNSKQLHFD